MLTPQAQLTREYMLIREHRLLAAAVRLERIVHLATGSKWGSRAEQFSRDLDYHARYGKTP